MNNIVKIKLKLRINDVGIKLLNILLSMLSYNIVSYN
jgi:hypothetical protein